MDNSVLALQVQPEVYDSNCSGGSESAVRVGIFCVKEHRDIIAFVFRSLPRSVADDSSMQHRTSTT